MKRKTAAFLLILVFLLVGSRAFPQTNGNELSAEELTEYKEKVKQLVSFLEFAINTVGDQETPTKEKEIIINSSYLKVFRDNQVIIEDDLDEDREIVANKNVQAYLKDVDFFFKEVKFQFDIEGIEYLANENGKNYFKVTLNRSLNGITVNSDTVKSVKKRYIEINLDEAQQDLKIASVYTTRLSEKEELVNWWDNLSSEWKAILKKEIGAYDSVGFDLIQQAVRIEKIDVSGNKHIHDLEGIGQLHNLRELNVSNTAVNDLLPLRNLTKLEVLDFSGAPVSDLEPLKYSIKLLELNAVSTQIQSLAFLENLENLKALYVGGNSIDTIDAIKNLSALRYLDLSNTRIFDLEALDSLFMLKELNISATGVSTLDPLKALDSLETLDIAGTNARSVQPLKGLPKLRIVICNNTPLSDIEALGNMQSLERIYCDNTLVTRNQANQFMAMNPRVLVIFKSDLLRNWWSELDETWKNIFIDRLGVSPEPNKEELAEIAKITEIDLSGNDSLKNLAPLAILENLRSVNISNTGIDDLTPLRELEKLEYLDCSFNPVKSLDPLSFLRRLKVVNIEKTESADLAPLVYHDNLEALYCDDSPVEAAAVRSFMEQHPSILVVYKTDSLVSWWNDLDPEWIKIFNRRLRMEDMTASTSEYQAKVEEPGEDIPSREDLHRIANLQILSIQNNSRIERLDPLKQLQNLKSLQVVNTRVSDLSPLSGLTKLRSLDVSYNPVANLSFISDLRNLVYLNIGNTPVQDLGPIAGLENIEELDCSGSQIKNLNALTGLYKLKVLNCSNTRVKSLSPVEDHQLASLSCFNTWISARKIEKFRKEHPDTEVRYY